MTRRKTAGDDRERDWDASLAVVDGYAHLAVAVIKQAIYDAQEGDLDAVAWLLSEDCASYLKWTGFDATGVQSQIRMYKMKGSKTTYAQANTIIDDRIKAIMIERGLTYPQAYDFLVKSQPKLMEARELLWKQEQERKNNIKLGIVKEQVP